jgi:hypothetical protein
LEVEWDMLNLVIKASEIVERKPWMNVLPSTRALRCKRLPDGMIRKLKTRCFARGDKQLEGVHFFVTFAPVCNWQTVKIMIILSLTFPPCKLIKHQHLLKLKSTSHQIGIQCLPWRKRKAESIFKCLRDSNIKENYDASIKRFVE